MPTTFAPRDANTLLWNATTKCCWAKPSVLAKPYFLALPSPQPGVPVTSGVETRSAEQKRGLGRSRLGSSPTSSRAGVKPRPGSGVCRRRGLGGGPCPSARFPTRAQDHQPPPSLSERFLFGRRPCSKENGGWGLSRDPAVSFRGKKTSG